jgi:hypothetical protein
LTWKRILGEPLLHFLLIGAGLFLAWGLIPRDQRSGEAGEIVVTQGQVEHLAAGFARTWQRPPSADELAGLVQDHIREEVYYREALAMGLDQNDIVIRRRLRQKLEFILDDVATRAEPTEAELQAYLLAHPETFRSEPRLSFRQIYLSPDLRGTRIEADAAQLLAQLNQAGAEVDAAALGDATLLESGFVDVAPSDVAAQFGADFADLLVELTVGEWHGPLRSAFGLHLVQVSERQDAALPALAEVRDTVRREWDKARRAELRELGYRELLSRYTVTVEGADAPLPGLAATP